MIYEQLVIVLRQKGNRKLAWFVEKYYILNKTKEEIMEEMYLDTVRWFYKMKQRVRDYVKNEYTKLDKIQ
jgi:hypothetical protein